MADKKAETKDNKEDKKDVTKEEKPKVKNTVLLGIFLPLLF